MNAVFTLNGLTIETERLILRPFRQDDLQDFYEYASVDGVGEMAGWQHHETIEKSQEILDMFIREDKTFAIVFKENGKIIGSLGIEKYGAEEALTEFHNYRGREIGYVLSKDYWGKGLMPEAVNTVVDYLFNTLDMDFLTCGYYDFNIQSKRVQEKCGFRPYRKLNMDTRLGTTEPGVLNLLPNPKKNISFVFSHPETLIWQEDTMKKQINKLVRDHIPSFCKNPETRILNDEDYTVALKQKLNEEVGEYLQDNTVEELADIIEVIEALAENQGSSLREVMEFKQRKQSKNGAFRDRIFLISVDR